MIAKASTEVMRRPAGSSPQDAGEARRLSARCAGMACALAAE